MRRRIGINKGGIKAVLKPLDEGGIDLSVQYAISPTMVAQI